MLFYILHKHWFTPTNMLDEVLFDRNNTLTVEVLVSFTLICKLILLFRLHVTNCSSLLRLLHRANKLYLGKASYFNWNEW